MSELTDRTKELQEKFAELDMDSDNLPPAIVALDGDPKNEEIQAQASFKYKKMKEASRLAKDVIAEQQQELKRLREEKPSPPQQPVGIGQQDPAQMGVMIEQQLTMQAMQKLGIADAANPLVQREVQALYQEQRDYARQMASAEADAVSAFDTVAAEFEDFTDEDKASIQGALSDVAAIDRTPERIRKEFYAHRGANPERFVKPGGNGKKKTQPDPGASAAAISSARKGVAPGEASPQGGDVGSVKPVTDEERNRMKSLPTLDPNNPADVAIFRRSARKRPNYSEQQH